MKIKSSIHNYEVNFESIEKLNVEKGDFIIIDSNIKNIKLDKISHYKVISSEFCKEYTYISKIIKYIINSGFRKNNKIIAIGGGVIQDISGFISSLLYRGVEWIFYPTTLLSQGDSCIGGKTSINFGDLKNQLGGFFPPNKIFIDTNFLKTLPKIEIYSGIGEMSHYFFIDGLESFNFYKNYDTKSDLKNLIKKSLQIKKNMVEIDEFDIGPRRVFNYGHSFGHAIESISNYEIPHGIAVSHGMNIANYISLKKGYITLIQYENMKNVLDKVNLKKKLPKIDIEDLINALKKDKKNVGDKFGLVLTKGLGNMFLEQNEPIFIEKLLKDYFNE
jgi:3-dehydroquinate synthase